MDFEQAFRAYRTFDPAGWVGIYRHVPMGAGIVAVAVGFILLLFGGGRAFRLVAGPLGAVVGLMWAAVVANKFGVTGLDAKVSAGAAIALGVLGFALPPGAIFFAFGIPAGLAAGEMAGPTDFILGFVPGWLLVGTLAAAFHRHIGAVAASLVGAWLLLIGMLSALHQVGGVVNAVTAQPWGVLIAAALFAVAGSVYQIAVRPSPEEGEKLKAERTRAKRKVAEKKALEQRWANYSDKKD
ncbi:MAG: hypothetical protein ACYC8T_00225 [Myxococcaceae bacterium]